jgi:hypothetical protein
MPKTQTEASVETVTEGIALCEENVKRLLRNARILLAHDGSDGLAYVLWSLAVEEFGKAASLRDAIAGQPPGAMVCVSLAAPHVDKFAAGLRALDERDALDDRLRWKLRVMTNTSGADTAIPNPLQPEQRIAVAPLRTGLLTDQGDDLIATVDLRFRLLYVDWDPDAGRWRRAGTTYRALGVEARWELPRKDLEDLIDTLMSYVEERTM